MDVIEAFGASIGIVVIGSIIGLIIFIAMIVSFFQLCKRVDQMEDHQRDIYNQLVDMEKHMQITNAYLGEMANRQRDLAKQNTKQ